MIAFSMVEAIYCLFVFFQWYLVSLALPLLIFGYSQFQWFFLLSWHLVEGEGYQAKIKLFKLNFCHICLCKDVNITLLSFSLAVAFLKCSLMFIILVLAIWKGLIIKNTWKSYTSYEKAWKSRFYFIYLENNQENKWQTDFSLNYLWRKTTFINISKVNTRR